IAGLWFLLTSLRSSRRRWRNRRMETEYAEREYRRWGGHRLPPSRVEPVLPRSISPPTEWGLELLHALEWQRLEILAPAYFEGIGFRARPTPFGADGGVDIELMTKTGNTPAILVQCKSWSNKPVGVKEARELRGVMAHRNIGEGILVTSGRFSLEARDFAKSN